MSRNNMHMLRIADTYYVKGVPVCHPPKPTLPKREAIGEQVLDWQDVVEQARCLDDGLVIDCEVDDWLDLTKPPSAPYCTESQRYNLRIAALLDADAKAKRTKAEPSVHEWRLANDMSAHPTRVGVRHGSLRQIRSRR